MSKLSAKKWLSMKQCGFRNYQDWDMLGVFYQVGPEVFEDRMWMIHVLSAQKAGLAGTCTTCYMMLYDVI